MGGDSRPAARTQSAPGDRQQAIITRELREAQAAGDGARVRVLNTAQLALDPLHALVYRSDDFTPAAFVSNRVDLSAAQLARVDLLPKLKNRTLVTKELAPLVAGKQEDLKKTFATLTAVLDGKGYLRDSGAHGQRGYAEEINFSWVGCTPPLSSDVLAVMAQLGPRILAERIVRTILGS